MNARWKTWGKHVFASVTLGKEFVTSAYVRRKPWVNKFHPTAILLGYHNPSNAICYSQRVRRQDPALFHAPFRHFVFCTVKRSRVTSKQGEALPKDEILVAVRFYVLPPA